MVSGAELEPAAAGQLAKVTTELDDIARMGMWLAAAESDSQDPKAKGMAAALRIAYADRLGLPAHAAQEIHLIKGNLTLSAKLCRALAHDHGLRVDLVDEQPDSVTAAVVETATSRELGRRTFTLAMAAKRGLSGQNWANAPDRMLWARASKMVLDDFAPWVTVGILAREEVEQDGYVPDEVLTGDVVDDDVPFEDAD